MRRRHHHWLLALLIAGAAATARSQDDPRDVFDAIGSVSLCPNDVPVLTLLDLDPDVDGPGGPEETGIEITVDSGHAIMQLFNPGTGDFLLAANRMALGSCTAGDRSRVILRFVDATAPGFDAGNPASWTYTQAQWITLEASESFDVGGGQFSLSAYRQLNQTDLVGTCGSTNSCEFADAIGIAELRMTGSPSDSTDNVLDDMVVRFVEPANTPVGSDVTVSSGDVDVTFPSVTQAGVTGAFSRSQNPTTEPLPGGLFSCDPAEFYTLETTATTAGDETVCIHYPDTCNEDGLALYHYHQTGLGCAPPPCGCLCPSPILEWDDITSSVDPVNDVICGSDPTLTLDPLDRPFIILSSSPPCSPESCDGLDNDCDGQVDEDFPVGDACSVGTGACRREGTWLCSADGSGVQCSVNPGSPSPETCNGVDDDCDGQIDDGFPVGNACTAGVGQCQAGGSLICRADGSGTQCDAVPGQPQAEICNGLDENCDGVIDDGDPGGGAACSTGLDGICDGGATRCSGGSLVCDQINFPSAEVCNGLDDDCDGAVDEDATDAPAWYPDGDSDGFGDPLGNPVFACAAPPGFVGNTDDCNDADPAVGATCNTPPTNDPVELPDGSPGVTVVLPNVTVGGDSTVTVENCSDTGGALPQGIALNANTLCVDVDTSAEFDGDAIVCITYDPADYPNPALLSMVRCPVPTPSPPDPPCSLLIENECDQPGETNCSDESAGLFCAFTPEFSTFAIGEPLDGDGDFTPDLADNCPADFNFFQDDGDADGAGDICDTCPVWANAAQTDTDGNGLGDACECGDQTGDGRVDVQDILAINEVIFEVQPASPLCDTNEDGMCNVQDILGANAKIFGTPAFCSRSPSGP